MQQEWPCVGLRRSLTMQVGNSREISMRCDVQDLLEFHMPGWGDDPI